MKVTTLELKMLTNMALDLYQPTNGGDPATFGETSAIWANNVIESAADKGVFASLLKKGLVYHDGESYDKRNRMNDTTCGLTEKGFNVYKSGKSTRSTTTRRITMAKATVLHNFRIVIRGNKGNKRVRIVRNVAAVNEAAASLAAEKVCAPLVAGLSGSVTVSVYVPLIKA